MTRHLTLLAHPSATFLSQIFLSAIYCDRVPTGVYSAVMTTANGMKKGLFLYLLMLLCFGVGSTPSSNEAKNCK
jgi:hypothetical protein